MRRPSETRFGSADSPGEKSVSAAAFVGVKVVADAVCTACGCTCDDVDLKAADDSTNDGATTIVAAERACTVGKQWFLNTPAFEDGPVCTVDGRPAPLDEGIDRAARLLLAARYPLVCGLTATTCEAQRVAVSIADWLGAVVDVLGPARWSPIGETFQGVGEVTCTLGEIRNRSKLLVYWGTDPADEQPRHFTKHALTPISRFLPHGRRDRYVVLVDARRTRTADVCDEFVPVRPDAHFEALWTLRALVAGVDVDPESTERDAGAPLAVWRALAERMRKAAYGALLYGDGLARGDGGSLNVEALSALTRDLNAHTRFVSLALGIAGNGAGAENVLTWRTGFPCGVNLARGYPRFNPDEYAANAVLARGEADAVLLVGGDATTEFDAAARARWAAIPTIVVGRPAGAAPTSAAVEFRTARYGLAASGTIYRADGVALTLRPASRTARPDDCDVLSRLERRLLELRRTIGDNGLP